MAMDNNPVNTVDPDGGCTDCDPPDDLYSGGWLDQIVVTASSGFSDQSTGIHNAMDWASYQQAFGLQGWSQAGYYNYWNHVHSADWYAQFEQTPLGDYAETVSNIATTAMYVPLSTVGMGEAGGLVYSRALAARTFPALARSAPTGKFYSVAYEMQLGAKSYPGVSRYMHFKEANIALNEAMKSNPMLGKLGISVPRSTSGSIIGKSPSGWVWHHHTSEGVMQLVPKSQHPNVPGGIFWETMHPGGVGGYSIWGK